MKKILITGATGQVGSWLCDYLLENNIDVEIHCVRRWRSPLKNTKTFFKKVNWHIGDLVDYRDTFDIVSKIKPDYIVHFAAQSFVAVSWSQPYHTMDVNYKMQLNILEAIRHLKEEDSNYDPIIHSALSSEEYGRIKVKRGTKITEDFPLAPSSPYGVSKVTQEHLCKVYWESFGIKSLRLRSFNHESPRRGKEFVTANFCMQVAKMEAKLQDQILYVGNIKSVRDWSDARDIVRGIWLGLNKADPNEVYNLCSGKAHTIQQFIQRLKVLSTIDFEIRIDPSRIRPSDVDYLLGDSSKFQQVTDWKLEYDFIEDTVPEMLNTWRNNIK